MQQCTALFLGEDGNFFRIFNKITAIFKNPIFYQMDNTFRVERNDIKQLFTVVRCELDNAPQGGTCLIEGKDVLIIPPEKKVC